MRKFWDFLKREEGSEIAEWGILFTLLLIASILAMAGLGDRLAAVWARVSGAIP